jgi:flagellar basal-body rod protein FlgC
MTDNFAIALRIAGAGLTAQSLRMRVASENVANAQVTGATAGADPYRRKTISFTDMLDAQNGAAMGPAAEIGTDQRPFSMSHEPGHPAADAAGMVKRSNVDVMVELADMREANRSYLANMQVIKQTRDALSVTLDLLRNT